MIDPKELRFGNWLINKQVSAATENTCYVRVDNLAHLYDINSVSWENLNPVPLTEEILEKCGFKKQEGKVAIFCLGMLTLWLGHNGCVASLKSKDRNENIYIPNPVKHLHQVQNLVFALTGEELGISVVSQFEILMLDRVSKGLYLCIYGKESKITSRHK